MVRVEGLVPHSLQPKLPTLHPDRLVIAELIDNRLELQELAESVLCWDFGLDVVDVWAIVEGLLLLVSSVLAILNSWGGRGFA